MIPSDDDTNHPPSHQNTPPPFLTPPTNCKSPPPPLPKHNFTIIAHNIHCYKNIPTLLDATRGTHVYLLTELNVPASALRYATSLVTQRGYNIIYAIPGLNSTGVKTLVRAAILYPRRVLALAQRTDVHFASATLLLDTPITVATGYALPLNGIEARRISTLFNEEVGRHPLFFAGDINMTQNHRFVYAPPPLRDVTPPEPNFVRGPAKTRPSAAFAAREVRILSASVLENCRVGDGHLPMAFNVHGLSWTLSCRRLMRELEEPEDLMEAADPATTHTKMEPRDRGLAVAALADYIAHGTLKTYNAAKQHFKTLALPVLPHSKSTRSALRRRIISMSRPDRHGTSHAAWGRVIMESRIGPPPSVIHTPSGISSDFLEVTSAHHAYWSHIWGHTVAVNPDLGYTDLLDMDRNRNREVLGAPLTFEEVRDTLATLNPKKSTADLDLTPLRSMGMRAVDGFPSGVRQVTEIKNLLNSERAGNVNVHVLLAPKTDTPDIHEHRPLGCIRARHLIRSRIYVKRVRTFNLPFHEANFTYRTGYAATDPVVAIHAYITSILDSSPWAVFGADGVKAYDSVPHALADQLMRAYGLDTQHTLYECRRIFFILVMAKGTAAAIRALRGLIQGDPWSCIVFTLLADALCHWTQRDLWISRLFIPFAQYVDDFIAVITETPQATALREIIEKHWKTMGMGASKWRLLRAGLPEVEGFDCTPVKAPLGCCVHVDGRACLRMSQLERLAEARIRTIRQLTFCDLTRGLLMERYVEPLFAHFPCPLSHETLTRVQTMMYDAISRGMPNFHRRFRGLEEGHHVRALDGGRNIPNLLLLHDEVVLRVVRQALSTPSAGRRYVELACQKTTPHHRLSIFHMAKAAMARSQITLHVASEARPIPALLPPAEMLCVDASYARNAAKIGIAALLSTGEVRTVTIGIEGKIFSSYQAEAAGLALVTLMGLEGPLSNDNMGCVAHNARMCALHPNLRQRLSLNNKAQPITLTVTRRNHSIHGQLTWVKGHVENAETFEQMLNEYADAASKAEGEHLRVHKEDLYTTHFPSYRRFNEPVGSLRPILSVRPAELYDRWGEGLLLEKAQRTMFAAPYFNKKTRNVTIPAAHVNTLMALRMRALVPMRSTNCVCACGEPIRWDFQHIVFECTHADHTTDYRSFATDLEQQHGVGWWLPPCRHWGHHCNCDPMEHYSCIHLIMGFPPSDARFELEETHPIIRKWIAFVHDRVTISHKANMQVH